MSQWSARVTALAAAAQCLAAVKQIAREGSLRDSKQVQRLLLNVLDLNPTSLEQMYPDPHELHWGLETLLLQIGPTQHKDIEITRYIVGLMALERRLYKRPQSMAKLAERLQHIQRQRDDFNFAQDTIIAGMAGLYSDVISPLSKPIKITGKPDHLKQINVQNQIRALLLAALRNIVLWRQQGGQRRQFIFSRQRMITTAQQLLRTSRIPSEPQS
ncbi:high frequency lysogenization protein HflD [Pseudidiomarina mangrovi]|uniref:high frequency lysogenization protein HflD n=1 Tax=Pseudidiomarina mangrovi TaxID=2487133 RepID=UPI000FCC8D16|nr:high frequency lysogenization protein HflD [Pseudidiomarina mangrovi]CAI8154239.1 MAG: High frequency lysogenization protein HflD [Pseudidiomarina mangrovi]